MLHNNSFSPSARFGGAVTWTLLLCHSHGDATKRPNVNSPSAKMLQILFSFQYIRTLNSQSSFFAARIYSDHPMQRQGFESTSVELHQPGIFWRMLYQLSYHAAARCCFKYCFGLRQNVKPVIASTAKVDISPPLEINYFYGKYTRTKQLWNSIFPEKSWR